MKNTVAIIGLGYVGLPLAIAFAKKHRAIGFDIDQSRIDELKFFFDRTREVKSIELVEATGLEVTSDIERLREASIFIVTVPTPIDEACRPDLQPLISASRSVGAALKPGALVIYESTVYPGATEEVCVPILEAESGLRFNKDFHCGYSPERINPGDKAHRVEDIIKVTSGSTAEAAQKVDTLYKSIIKAGTHLAPSIRVAEAAKVIENTQRDVNIALINELAMLFNCLDIDTQAVLDAAGTKWNFLPFKPGLVGGHCIGVDPYYLTHKAQQVGFHPAMILAGRRTNDGMGAYVARQMVKALLKERLPVKGAKILILGLAFKENCPDIRNTRVVDIIKECHSFGIELDIHDPWVDSNEAQREYGIALVHQPPLGEYEGVIVAVAHKEFHDQHSTAVRAFCKPNGIVYDLKHLLPRDQVDLRL